MHHSDRGSQYVSIRYTERLAEAGIEPSVDSVGDSYDNALAEPINGLYEVVPLSGQVGGNLKLDPNDGHAANWSLRTPSWTSAGVRPPNDECGRRRL